MTHWRAWAASRDVRFIDGFAPFIREPAEAAIRRYFIAGGAHFSGLNHRPPFDGINAVSGHY